MGNKGKKGKRQLHQGYVFELILRKGKKGGIKAVTYWDKILIDLLYPFYEKVQKVNPT